MELQNQIKRTLSTPEAIESVRRLLEDESVSSRIELAELVCEEFGFQDPRGENQWGGCLKALREVEAQGEFQLPPHRREKVRRSPRRLDQPVAEPEAVPGEVDEIGGLELIL